MRLTTTLSLVAMITAAEVYAHPDHAEKDMNNIAESCNYFDVNKDGKNEYEVCITSKDGKPTKIVQKFYDHQHALPVKEIEDREANGTPDFIIIRQFNGKRFRQFNYDVTTQPHTEFVYNSQGKLCQKREVVGDYDQTAHITECD